MYLPRPAFNADAKPLEIKRYMVSLVEAIEAELTKLEEKGSLTDSEN